MGIILAVLSGIYNKDPFLVSAAGFAFAIGGLVVAKLIKYDRSLVNFVSFTDENVFLEQNSGKRIIIPRYAVSEITERFSLVEIVCCQNGITKTYRMQIRFLPFRKYVPDINE